MFEFLFKYPLTVFSKGTFVFLGRWPLWVFLVCILVAAAAFAVPMWRRRAEFGAGIRGLRPAGVWLMQTLFVTILLFMLWQPAVSIATLRPQQNIVAVIVDDSKSMGLTDGGKSRREQAVSTLNGGMINELQKKFQVRLYRGGDKLQRIESLDKLDGSLVSTHLGDTLKLAVAEGSNVPIGAVVLLSDGADNSGGIDLATLNEIRRQRIPIHTIGYGRDRASHDVELSDAQLPARALADSRLTALVSFHQHGYTGRKGRLLLKDGGKVLAAQDVTFKDEGVEQTEAVPFNAGAAGARSIQVAIEAEGEENQTNNSLNRMVNVDGNQPRVLYIEGEPRWEFKFIRRAAELDKNLGLVSILRTTQNKTYT